jgi:hypothetical protein
MAPERFNHTFGAEIEKPISSSSTGESHGVSQDFFKSIADQHEGAHLDQSDIQPETTLAVDVPGIGHVGLDNAFNLQETASVVTHTLSELARISKLDLHLVQQALLAEGATVINLALHPQVMLTDQNYRAFVAPKGVYEYILARGWDHKAGIDAKAQNSPSTSVHPEDAARAVSTMIGAGAAIVGLFGNSPFAEQQVSPFKETRLTIWDMMMASSSSNGDRKTASFPEQPFLNLKDYFGWMFGTGTNIHFVLAQDADYKTFGDAALTVENNPSVLSYLAMPNAIATFLRNGGKSVITPHLRHLEAMQFSQFTGARIRWQFDHSAIDRTQFLAAYDNNTLERLFTDGGVKYTYIEGRDAGATFPDRELMSINVAMAKTAPMAPSAIQAGLLQNLDEASDYILSKPWKQLSALRNAAIRNGLEGHAADLSVYNFACDILQIAARGLSSQDQKLLAYPEFVLTTKQNGADRALAQYAAGMSIRDIVKSRSIVLS